MLPAVAMRQTDETLTSTRSSSTASGGLEADLCPVRAAIHDSRKNLPYLDSIRGLAAFVVVLGHLAVMFYPGWCDGTNPMMMDFPVGLLLRGDFAVRLFFVLSGFVLSLAYFEKRDLGVLASAAFRRYFRLMIPALSSVIVAFVIFQAGWMHHREVAFWTGGKPELFPYHGFDFEMGWHEAFHQGIFGTFFDYNKERTLNACLWTMPVELRGSFLVFSFLALCGGLRRRWPVYLVFGGLLFWQKHFFYLDFLVGIATCDAFVSARRTRGCAQLSPLAGVFVLLTGLFVGIRLLPSGSHVAVVPSVGALLIIGSVLLTPFLQRLLMNRTCMFLGRISFPLYLIHLSVLCSLSAGVYVRMREWTYSHDTSAIAAAIACLSVSMLAAWVLHLAVDRPAIRIGKRMENIVRSI